MDAARFYFSNPYTQMHMVEVVLDAALRENDRFVIEIVRRAIERMQVKLQAY